MRWILPDVKGAKVFADCPRCNTKYFLARLTYELRATIKIPCSCIAQELYVSDGEIAGSIAGDGILCTPAKDPLLNSRWLPSTIAKQLKSVPLHIWDKFHGLTIESDLVSISPDEYFIQQGSYVGPEKYVYEKPHAYELAITTDPFVNCYPAQPVSYSVPDLTEALQSLGTWSCRCKDDSSHSGDDAHGGDNIYIYDSPEVHGIIGPIDTFAKDAKDETSSPNSSDSGCGMWDWKPTCIGRIDDEAIMRLYMTLD
ncbi:hypothetical protein VHEMI04725 [[Torrubiella] hemipterigena]|uniref:Uncharacterized protein n=1 Tax=[Torrubiella] hemipterigena TaxID=1531966 RepID=A0A0A1SW23_9HYPO|nr:hypothetical protein VHEMI04725 [[Torrubiella] hemipterigena]